MKRIIIPVTLIFALFLTSCQDESPVPTPVVDFLKPPAHAIAVPASEQTIGNAEAGRDYMYNGEFEESGIPYSFIAQGTANDNLLGREGENSLLPHNFTTVTAPNGVKVAAPNCFSCHAQVYKGQIYVGVGNSLTDDTNNGANNVPTLDAAINAVYGVDSPEYQAYEPFRKASLALGPHLIAPFKGVNSAGKLTQVLAAHRDQNSLVWIDEPTFDLEYENFPSDVPAWWLLKKKNAMFLDASGRGDFRKFNMASVLLTVSGVEKAEEIYQNFDDVLAYIYSIEPPEYPLSVEQSMVDIGAELFYENCAKCHGTYGDEETYPNLIVNVGTDLYYTQRKEQSANLLNWWEDGWFGTSHDPSFFSYEGAYLAPPLDGVWATAPYLHNASVPDLATLLDSSARPQYWKRDFDNPQYNEDFTGWEYEVMTEAVEGDKEIYNTALPGYGNGGHNYGDGFSEDERAALIEYLKTL